MSDGYLRAQGKGAHQVIIFTFAGELPRAHVDAWNAAIRDLKVRFKDHVVGVTLKGERTPPEMRRTQRRK